jgi:hypothetical protein
MSKMVLRPTKQLGERMCIVALAAFGTGAATLPALSEGAPREALTVSLDQAKLVRLPSGAETIVIGNPSIADVSVQKNGVMVITGRAPGRTNFIALDSSGSILSESMVSVTTGSPSQIVVQRGLERNTYDCSPACLPMVSLGDEEKHFGRSVDQVGKRDGMANQSAAPKK